MMNKVKISTYAKMQGVTYRTIWNWCQAGKIQFERAQTGTYFIILPEDNTKRPLLDSKVAIYCRVSSAENKSNLESQKNRCLNFCAAKGLKVDKVVTEIGSGLNDNRKLLKNLINDDSITTIVVEHKDRLARFGTGLIEDLLKKQNRSIMVINEADNQEEDLMGDFISIVTSFCARLYGQRRCKRKTENIIKELQSECY